MASTFCRALQSPSRFIWSEGNGWRSGAVGSGRSGGGILTLAKVATTPSWGEEWITSLHFPSPPSTGARRCRRGLPNVGWCSAQPPRSSSHQSEDLHHYPWTLPATILEISSQGIMIGPLTKDGLIVAIVQPAICTWRKRDLGQNTLQPPAAGQAGVAKYCFQEAANCKTCNSILLPWRSRKSRRRGMRTILKIPILTAADVRTHALAGLLFILVSLRRCLQLIMHSAQQILTVLCLKIFNARWKIWQSFTPSLTVHR